MTKAVCRPSQNLLEKELDFSFCDILDVNEITFEFPRQSPRKKDGKYSTNVLKLNNNKFSSLKGLDIACSAVIVDYPQKLAMLDLSWNEITTISEVLLEFHSLYTLYLHGNRIGEINDVDKLSKLKHLRKLSLYSNPIEKHCRNPPYRIEILQRLPDLKELDFSGVSVRERDTATTLQKFKAGACRIKIPRKEEEDY